MNCKEEFLKIIEGYVVECVYMELKETEYNLRMGHTNEDFKRFLGMIDFEYDSGYGEQNLYGTIWFKDRTWAERGEYDGSEWWEHKEYPEIPEKLQ